ncbi:SWIM-type domain-containing protein, partial [Favolaschia claudopus]
GKCARELEITPENWQAIFGANGLEILKTCRTCLEKKQKQKANAAAAAGNERKNERADNSVNASAFIGQPAVPAEDFFVALRNAEDVHNLTAYIDVSGLALEEDEESPKEIANIIAERVYECLGYRFHFHTKRAFGSSDMTRYEYNCAQSSSQQRKSIKVEDVSKQRDKGKMTVYPCDGWLTIWGSADTSEWFVRIRHNDCHQKYVSVEVPPDVKAYILENVDLRTSQLWKQILVKHPKPTFTRKSVYNIWAKAQQDRWKRHEDELKSARILLEEFSKQGSKYEVEPIPLPDGGKSAGFQAFAFAIPTFLRKWAGKIREIGLDSTFNTTKAGYECFVILGEVFGSGVPLGFLFLKSHNPDPGEKENYLRSMARHLVRTWGMEVMQCLSDKDISEINALLAELPDDVKYQLCFWHAIRAVKGRLAVVGRQPAYYNADEAFSEYDWIDRDFVPINQMTPTERESANLEVAQDALPTIRVVFNNQPVPSAPARPRIVINLNGHNVGNNTDSQAALEEFVDSLNDDDEEYLDDAGAEDLDLSDRPDAAPSWLEPGDKTTFAVVAGYIFCPSPHRRQLLRLFIRHFCEHPLLPDRRGTSRTAKQIRDDAVRDMYLFCFQRGLREVWGYMWSAWYCPAKWKLWARSTSEDFIGRWRTTMTVENFWRNLKHRTLHEFVHPRLDQVFYL